MIAIDDYELPSASAFIEGQNPSLVVIAAKLEVLLERTQRQIQISRLAIYAMCAHAASICARTAARHTDRERWRQRLGRAPPMPYGRLTCRVCPPEMKSMRWRVLPSTTDALKNGALSSMLLIMFPLRRSITCARLFSGPSGCAPTTMATGQSELKYMAGSK